MPDPVADIMKLAYTVAGIHLGELKRGLVEARLGKRLRALNCTIGDYAKRVRADEDELVQMIDLLTTNHTAWRREPDHFADFEERVLGALVRARGKEPRPRLRIWCAAAATGEEPWTIALSVVRAIPDIERWDCAVLATDISTRALAKAKAGRYDEQRVAPLPASDRQLALDLVEKGPPKVWAVTPRLRALVHFARLNLMEDWPIRGPFDIIFCRNVMIYFDQPTQERLVNRLGGLLERGGTLYVGHSESLSAIKHPLRPAGPATYVR